MRIKIHHSFQKNNTLLVPDDINNTPVSVLADSIEIPSSNNTLLNIEGMDSGVGSQKPSSIPSSIKVNRPSIKVYLMLMKLQTTMPKTDLTVSISCCIINSVVEKNSLN